MPVTTRLARYLAPGGARDERGATAIITAIIITALLSVGALTIDYGQASLARRQTQNAADSAALSIAARCAKEATTAAISNTCRTRYRIDEAPIVRDTAPDASFNNVGQGASGARSVRVAVDKRVTYKLAYLLGQDQATVVSRATAEWTNLRPTEGYPVLPLGVSYCTWKNKSGNAGKTTESAIANRVALRTDPLQRVGELAAPLTQALPVQALLSALGVNNRETCSDVDGRQLLTLQGAVWLTGESVVRDTVRGVFGYEASECKLRTANSTFMYVGTLTNSAIVPQACYDKLGRDVKIDQTILLPIYKPANPQGLEWTGVDKLGLRAEACVGLNRSANRTCLTAPPQIGVEIVGYAPFRVTGYLYPGKDQRDASVACSANTVAVTTSNILDAVGGLVTDLLTILPRLLGGSGRSPATLGCSGLQGYFTKSFTKDPNFEYGTGGADLGAGLVRLTQ